MIDKTEEYYLHRVREVPEEDEEMGIEPELQRMVDLLIYRSYRFNRQRSPWITPKQWELIFGSTSELEEMFQAEHFMTKGSVS